MTEYLFVYGTLGSTHQNEFSALLKRSAKFIGGGKIRGKLYDIGDYPGAIKSSSNYIHGEVYELRNPGTLIPRLDEYEGFYPKDPEGSEYFRTKEIVNMDDGRELSAWVYWYKPTVRGKSYIKEGDYLNYLKTKKQPQPLKRKSA